MRNKLLYVFVLALLTATGCAKDDLEDLGTGTSTLKISAALAIGSQAKMQMNQKFSGGLNFDSGYIWVSEVEFDGTLERGTSVNRRVRRFSKIDFVTGEAVPSLDDITIPAGNYNFVNIGVELRDEDIQPAIVMQGTYQRSNGEVVPLRFEFNSGETFEAESTQQVMVEENTTVLSKIIIDPYQWFTKVPVELMDTAELNASGVLFIADDFNEEIYDQVADGLDDSAESEFSN